MSVVSNKFVIPCTGILGSEFFIRSKSKIDFENQTLSISDERMPFYHGKTSFPSIINLKAGSELFKLPYLTLNVWGHDKLRFLIDTGAKVRLLVERLYIAQINTTLTTRTRGIEPNLIKIKGIIQFNILGTVINCHVELGKFPIRCEGILGSDYLTKGDAIIDFENLTLKVNGSRKEFTLHSDKSVFGFTDALKINCDSFSNLIDFAKTLTIYLILEI